MTVGELVYQLLQLSPLEEVLLAADDEGNSFRVASVAQTHVGRGEGYDYEIYDADDPDYEPDEDDKQVVVIW